MPPQCYDSVLSRSGLSSNSALTERSALTARSALIERSALTERCPDAELRGGGFAVLHTSAAEGAGLADLHGWLERALAGAGGV